MRSLLVKFFTILIRALVAAWQRDRELKDAGKTEAITEADREADERKKLADAARHDWDALDDAGRERVRNERHHYRD